MQKFGQNMSANGDVMHNKFWSVQSRDQILQAESRQKVDVFERRMYISETTDIDAKIFSVFEHTIDHLFLSLRSLKDLRIKRSQLRWFGHVNRLPRKRLPKQALLAKANEKRSVGLPRTRWTNYIKDLEWNCSGLHPCEIMKEIKDREV